MADERLIPNRPIPDESKIPAADKDLLTYSIAFAVPNQKAFALWHPEFLDSSGKLNKTGRAACTQFFNYAKNREYADAYFDTLSKFIRNRPSSGCVDVAVDDIDDNRKDKVLKQLLSQAMSLVESGEGLDPDTMKTVVEVFRKLNILKDDVEVQEAPRRYLPERCSACLYRSFMESHVESGEIINECDFCRTRKFAEENGWRFDPTKNLDLPIENNQ